MPKRKTYAQNTFKQQITTFFDTVQVCIQNTGKTNTDNTTALKVKNKGGDQCRV